MKKPLDRITEAYYSELGETFAEKVRTRIHWICESAKGEDILDVGASQGITSILLGREGKSVLGIDLLKDSIDYANDKLSKEETYTQENVVFKHANFMTENFGDHRYDSIILGEVLEHITEPERFIEKAASLLKSNGRLVVTVPFGINDYFDHKKTYYLVDLLRFQNDEIQAVHVEFFGKWIGVIYEKDVAINERVHINDSLVEKLEKEFYKIERDLIESIKALRKKNKHTEDNLVKETSEIKVLKERVDESELFKTTQIMEKEYLLDKINELELENSSLIADYDLLKKDTEKYKLNSIMYKTKLEMIEEENKRIFSENQMQLIKIDAQNDELTNLKKVITNYEIAMNKNDEELTNKENIEIKKMQTEINKHKNIAQSAMQTKQKLDKRNQELYRELNIAVKEKITVNERLLASYEKEERLLRTYTNLNTKLENLEWKYNAISNSKLGSLQLAYWRKKGERKRKRT